MSISSRTKLYDTMTTSEYSLASDHTTCAKDMLNQTLKCILQLKNYEQDERVTDVSGSSHVP